MAHVPQGTTNATIEAIMHLKDYTTMQMVEVVRYLLYTMYVFYIPLFFTYSSWIFATDCSRGPQSDKVVLSSLWIVVSSRKNQGVHDLDRGLLEEVVGQARNRQNSQLVAWKVTEEGTGLLRKTELKNNTL